MTRPEPRRPISIPTFQPDDLLQDTYRILQPLAAGGMGEIYIARHERLQCDVAVKVLSRGLVDDIAARVRFEREAGILSVLRHPHIVQVFDFNITTDGVPYLVMELLDGPTLSEVLGTAGPLPPAQVARVVKQIASALEAAHSRGVVHRDLKPDNVILLAPEGELEFVKVFDFGICRAIGSPRLTTDTSVLGTPEYMAPEQARGGDLDVRTDEFALAAMAYTMLSGQQPFRGDKPVSVLYQVVHQDPPPLGARVDFPADSIEAVIRRALSKDPEARYPRVLDFAQAFEGAVADMLGLPPPPSAALRAAGTGPHLALPPRRPSSAGLLVSDTSAEPPPGAPPVIQAQLETGPGTNRVEAPLPALPPAHEAPLRAQLAAAEPSAPAIPDEGAPQLAARRKARVARWVIPAFGFFGVAVATYQLSPERTRAASELIAEPVARATSRSVAWMRRCLTWKGPPVGVERGAVGAPSEPAAVGR